MIMFEYKGQSRITLSYPLGSVRGYAKAVKWNQYKQWMYGFTAFGITGLVYAIWLFNQPTVSDQQFQLVLVPTCLIGVARIWKMRGGTRIAISECSSIRIAPTIVGIDFFFYSALAGLCLVIFASQSPQMTKDIFELVGLCSFFYAFYPIANAVAYYFGIGRKI